MEEYTRDTLSELYGYGVQIINDLKNAGETRASALEQEKQMHKTLKKGLEDLLKK